MSGNEVRVTVGPQATEEVGAALATALRPGDLLALDGDLGAGKTTLVRGLAVALGADPLEVRSPTFVLHHIYRTPRLPLHHLDLYRLGAGADLATLDLDTLLEEGAAVVEWGSYGDLSDYRPVRLELEVVDERRRLVRLVDAPARFASALAALPA